MAPTTHLVDGWACRHLALARTLSWSSITLGTINALLQIAVSYAAFQLAEVLARETELWVADSETATFAPISTDTLLPFPPSDCADTIAGVTTALPRPEKLVGGSRTSRSAG